MAFILADTNLLLRGADPPSAAHKVAKEAMALLAASGHTVCLTPQVLVEFWTVVTRPTGSTNGLGWTTLRAEAEIEELRGDFLVLDDRAEIFSHWCDLVRTHDIKGKRSHDARLAAVMKAYGVKYLLTFNGTDFAPFPNVTVLDPVKVAAGEVMP